MTTRAKICGITTPDALEAAISGGADYIGLVFFPKSPRHLAIAQAKALAAQARGKAQIVALTVDANDATLQEIVDEVAPDILQLHGREVPERVALIKKQFGRAIIKAIPVASADDAASAQGFTGAADLILFDAKAPPGSALPGGNGMTFDWRALEGVAGAHPFMLSGGLGPDNVAEAIALTQPMAVDVSSGVESAPGIKDPSLIHRFLLAIKTAKQT
ncbi:phosphoribosylanthranilate isomerase [Hyphomicrobium sp.]|uniref:phosphoribosylanthranilate isomerase n=1 Tax=Hyphomicrobium sp. TaxID=82 RepID=UPI002D78F3CA|nr:phosphoribosylanthranilate isomerase [Hyphomicrobium sp.]HET6388604.1 phosphoribosylanthranilate isomerase [Hyphomicrobium sp.]